MSADRLNTMEKPENGIAGLKYLRHDILSGIVVSLVSLPLSSGIAIASGLPPIVGLISAIIAGVVFPFVGGGHVTIAGPAAGLAPAIMAALIWLGGAGDAEHLGEGYQYLLVVICLVGFIQIMMSLLKLARFAALIPVTVVEGMLASIGLLIIVKQLPMFFGYSGKIQAKEFIDYLISTPEYAGGLTVAAFSVALASLVMLFIFDSLKQIKVLEVIPPQLIVVVIGVVLGNMANLQSLGPGFLITIPENPVNGIHTPDFNVLLARSDLWQAAFAAVVMLTLIDGIESLATAMAIDRIDPFRRKSDANRVLLAMGISNVASSLFGGLTIIPGGVKSKVNIAAGGRTLWANFTNAVCLMIYLMVGARLINMIPLGVLASVLIFTGWKLCAPMVWRNMALVGKEQIVIFSLTVIVTLLSDLLIGIAAGVVSTYIISAVICRHAIASAQNQRLKQRTVLGCMRDFFRNPVYQREYGEGIYHIFIDKPLVCFNCMHLSEELDEVPSDAKGVRIHLEESIPLIDQTAAETLTQAVKDFAYANVPVELIGLDQLERLSGAETSVRVASSVS